MPTMPSQPHTLRDGRVVTLRSLKEDDAAALIRYLDVIRRETPFLLWGPADDLPDLEKERRWVRQRIDQPSGLTVSAWDGDQCAGIAQIDGNTGFARRRHAASIGLSVLGAFHGVGLGTKLMAMLMDWARQHPKIDVVDLTVLAHNERAIATYHRAGFVITGRKPRAIRYEDGTYGDELYMAAWTGPAEHADTFVREAAIHAAAPGR